MIILVTAYTLLVVGICWLIAGIYSDLKLIARVDALQRQLQNQ